MTRLNWRFVIFSDALWCGAATRPGWKIAPLSIYVSSYWAPVVTQTSASTLLRKQQHSPLLSTAKLRLQMWNICLGYWQSQSIYRFGILECNLSKWGCDLFAVVGSRLKGHISGQKRRLKGSTSLCDPLKSIQGMKTLLSPLRLRDQFSFIQRSSENCNLKFVNEESWLAGRCVSSFHFQKTQRRPNNFIIKVNGKKLQTAHKTDAEVILCTKALSLADSSRILQRFHADTCFLMFGAETFNRVTSW